MANMKYLDSFTKLSDYSTFGTRCWIVLELMGSLYGPVSFNLINIEPSFIIEKWPRFNTITDVDFNVTSLLVLCILSSVNKNPGVIKLFCDHPILTWEHVKHIPSRHLTSITKGPENGDTLLVTFQNPYMPIWIYANVYLHIISKIE